MGLMAFGIALTNATIYAPPGEFRSIAELPLRECAIFV
jgi:hypothetical protein